MNREDIASSVLGAAAALLILWILVLLSRTSEAVALLDGRLAALEIGRGGPKGVSARPGTDTDETGEESWQRELAAIRRDLESAAYTQMTLERAAGSTGSTGVPRTYADLVKTIRVMLTERDRRTRLEDARKTVEIHVQLATHYSDKLAVGLNLDADQKVKVLEIVRDQVRAYEPILALELIDEEALAEVARIDKEIDRRILAELKPEQALKYEDIKRPWLQALVHRSGAR